MCGYLSLARRPPAVSWDGGALCARGVWACGLHDRHPLVLPVHCICLRMEKVFTSAVQRSRRANLMKTFFSLSLVSLESVRVFKRLLQVGAGPPVLLLLERGLSQIVEFMSLPGRNGHVCDYFLDQSLFSGSCL